MISELISVKNLRLDSAKRGLVKAKEHVLKCQQDLKEHDEKLAEYIQFVKTEKNKKFQKLQESNVKLKSIDKYNEDISILKQRLLDLRTKQEDLQKTLNDAVNQETNAKIVYQKCLTDLKKFEEVEEEFLEQEKYLVLMQEEAEQEDVSSGSKMNEVNFRF